MPSFVDTSNLVTSFSFFILYLFPPNLKVHLIFLHCFDVSRIFISFIKTFNFYNHFHYLIFLLLRGFPLLITYSLYHIVITLSIPFRKKNTENISVLGISYYCPAKIRSNAWSALVCACADIRANLSAISSSVIFG